MAAVPASPHTLVLLVHPSYERSRANRALAAALRDLAGVTFRDLYEVYPDWMIDASAEQRLLVAHRNLVVQHPFYWYSCPALFKEWLDHVLTRGFAYGPGGDALRGKRWLSAITTGGPADSYTPSGLNQHTMPHLLAPFEQTARLCGMTFDPPFLLHDTHAVTDQALASAATHYRDRVSALSAH